MRTTNSAFMRTRAKRIAGVALLCWGYSWLRPTRAAAVWDQPDLAAELAARWLIPPPGRGSMRTCL